MSEPMDEYGLPLWPAPERNKGAIGELLRQELPETGLLLEIASATGQHALHFLSALPGWTIQPSDCDPAHLATLRRRVELTRSARLLAPLELDVMAPPAGLSPDAIFCANMLHIAPWAASVGLFDVARRSLQQGQRLLTYGPYSVHGAHSASSNDRFDQSLRSRNSEWGVRDVDDLSALANARGVGLLRTHQMPANNLLLVWERR